MNDKEIKKILNGKQPNKALKELKMFFVLLMLLTAVVGIIGGMGISEIVKIKEGGLVFECNPYTSNDLNRNGCNASLKIPYQDIEMVIVSNFDSIKVLT